MVLSLGNPGPINALLAQLVENPFCFFMVIDQCENRRSPTALAAALDSQSKKAVDQAGNSGRGIGSPLHLRKGVSGQTIKLMNRFAKGLKIT